MFLRPTRLRWRLLVVFLAFFRGWVPSIADTVVLRDGSQISGEVLGLDSEKLTLRDPGGAVKLLLRSQISKVLFEPANPPLKIEVRCAAADDELDLLLNGDAVLERAGPLGTGWVDVSEKARNGNNEFRARVRNERTSWAYRWELRVNGKVTVFSCGQPGIKGKGCTCCGLRGDERGVIDRIDPIWVHVDRSVGKAEILGQ